MTVELLSLEDHLARLVAFCRQLAAPPPTWRATLVLDTSDPRVRYEAGTSPGWIAPAEVLLPPAHIADRFDALLRSGYAWINLSAYGVFAGDLVVAIELPREPADVPPGATSVNYSGPAHDRAGLPDWNLRLTLTS